MLFSLINHRFFSPFLPSVYKAFEENGWPWQPEESKGSNEWDIPIDPSHVAGMGQGRSIYQYYWVISSVNTFLEFDVPLFLFQVAFNFLLMLPYCSLILVHFSMLFSWVDFFSPVNFKLLNRFLKLSTGFFCENFKEKQKGLRFMLIPSLTLIRFALFWHVAFAGQRLLLQSRSYTSEGCLIIWFVLPCHMEINSWFYEACFMLG